MLWLEPLFDEKCNVTVNLLDLDLEMLYKIKEYRAIRNTVEEFHIEEEKAKMEKSLPRK